MKNRCGQHDYIIINFIYYLLIIIIIIQDRHGEGTMDSEYRIPSG